MACEIKAYPYYRLYCVGEYWQGPVTYPLSFVLTDIDASMMFLLLFYEGLSKIKTKTIAIHDVTNLMRDVTWKIEDLLKRMIIMTIAERGYAITKPDTARGHQCIVHRGHEQGPMDLSEITSAARRSDGFMSTIDDNFTGSFWAPLDETNQGVGSAYPFDLCGFLQELIFEPLDVEVICVNSYHISNYLAENRFKRLDKKDLLTRLETF